MLLRKIASQSGKCIKKTAILGPLTGSHFLKQVTRGYRTMPPESYLMNQKDSNYTKKIHMNTLYPLPNSSRPSYANLETTEKEPLMRSSSSESLMETIGSTKTITTTEIFTQGLLRGISLIWCFCR